MQIQGRKDEYVYTHEHVYTSVFGVYTHEHVYTSVFSTCIERLFYTRQQNAPTRFERSHASVATAVLHT